MLRKVSFLFITLFWVTMNALLWREEFSSKNDLGAEAPVGLVWEKILTSPDDSGLAVQYGKDRVGYVRWIPNIGQEEATGKTANENSEIEGRIKKLTGYTIHADGNFILPEENGRFRFDFSANFDAAHQWTSWQFKSLQRPSSWTIAADRKTETLDLMLGEGRAALKQSFRFADFRNPQKLIADIGLAGSLPAVAAMLPSALADSPTNSLSVGLKWEARQDWLKMGHSRVRIYRLRARILDKYEANILVSRVGEILRVELPGEVVLVNEALINL
jgi:hypothetical protein